MQQNEQYHAATELKSDMPHRPFTVCNQSLCRVMHSWLCGVYIVNKTCNWIVSYWVSHNVKCMICVQKVPESNVWSVQCLQQTAGKQNNCGREKKIMWKCKTIRWGQKKERKRKKKKKREKTRTAKTRAIHFFLLSLFSLTSIPRFTTKYKLW